MVWGRKADIGLDVYPLVWGFIEPKGVGAALMNTKGLLGWVELVLHF